MAFDGGTFHSLKTGLLSESSNGYTHTIACTFKPNRKTQEMSLKGVATIKTEGGIDNSKSFFVRIHTIGTGKTQQGATFYVTKEDSGTII